MIRNSVSYGSCAANHILRSENLVLFFVWQHIFLWEQEEYKKEGIDWTSVTFADNKPVLASLTFLIRFQISSS